MQHLTHPPPEPTSRSTLSPPSFNSSAQRPKFQAASKRAIWWLGLRVYSCLPYPFDNGKDLNYSRS